MIYARSAHHLASPRRVASPIYDDGLVGPLRFFLFLYAAAYTAARRCRRRSLSRKNDASGRGVPKRSNSQACVKVPRELSAAVSARAVVQPPPTVLHSWDKKKSVCPSSEVFKAGEGLLQKPPICIFAMFRWTTTAHSPNAI